MANSRENARLSTATDVFDDEYAVDDFDRVADGFAPGRVEPADSRWSIHSADPSIRNGFTHISDAPRFSTGPSRNSMHKPRDGQNPFSSTEDEDDRTDQRSSTIRRSQSIQSTSTVQYAPGIAHRLSTATFARTSSPLPGATGPSHPYAMYPQDTNLARNSSTSTTASTIRVAQPLLAASQGPTHPYSMYPQDVSGHDDEEHHDATTASSSRVQTVIPVGFPGRTQVFVRARGTEDEEQDIIGVDGHSEQLPPYSEYPEDGVPKPIALPGQLATPPNGTQVHIPLIQQQQQRRPESMSDQADAEMQQLTSTDPDGSSSEKKSWNEKSWKEKRKTRVCGIPFWWILLSLCVLAFISIVLGAAIGGIFASARKEAEKATVHRGGGASATLLDASPIPTSSIGAPPPTGVYALDFGPPRATQSACISNQNYSAAWDCNIYGTPQMAINIGSSPDGSNSEGASLYGFNNATGINYGTQPPNTQFAPFISVQDDDEPYRGPAFYFQTFYDKFVVVPENALPASNAATPHKRSYIDTDWFTQHQVQAGDKPWFCWFNGTFLEGFIYANNFTAAPTSSASASMTTSILIKVAGPSTTATLATAYQGNPAASTQYTQPSTARRVKHEPPEPIWTLDKRTWTFAELSSFGYVVKIEERRVPDSPEPYCNQFQILNNGLAGPLIDPTTNQQITVNLSETDPDYSAYQQQQASSASEWAASKVKRDPISGACHCEWWSGGSAL